MDLRNRAIALYGRFSSGVRDALQREVVALGGGVARDLTRRSDLLVVGSLAAALIDSGALSARLRVARERGVPVLGERAFDAVLSGEAPPDAATFPLSTALSQTTLTREDAEILAAFDLIVVAGENCRFGDAGVIRAASELIGCGRSRADVVRILARARDLSPLGRHKIVLTPSGEAALQWQDGLTTLEGQGYLPLDEDHAGVDALFEAAMIAEANGEPDEAGRLYDMCGRADRGDAIAPYNFANIRLAQGAHDQAILAYRQALSRDAEFIEARYNLAQALEAAGKLDEASTELSHVLEADPTHSDAVFNLAQLRMKAGDMSEAKVLYERYLALGPPDDWAATARRAILYCQGQLSAWALAGRADLAPSGYCANVLPQSWSLWITQAARCASAEGFFAMMIGKALLPVLGELNAAFGAQQLQTKSIHSAAFAPGKPLGPALAGVVGSSHAELASVLQLYVSTMPGGFQEALRSIIYYALTSDPQVLLTFAWAPAYDFEMTMWEIVEPPEVNSGITILLKGRYPDHSERFAAS